MDVPNVVVLGFAEAVVVVAPVPVAKGLEEPNAVPPPLPPPTTMQAVWEAQATP